MSVCNVCLVVLIWCQVLNLSAAESEESVFDDGNRGNGTVFTVFSNRTISHSPEAGWDTKSKGATSGEQGTASGFRFHQEKLLEELKDYKFVFPQLVSGRRKRSIAILPQAWYPSHIRISVILEGKDLILDLNRNRFLLPRGFQVLHYDSNGTLVTETDTEMYHCYYVGSVRRFPGSQVSASTCSGLSALIMFSNRTYVIEPVEGVTNGRHLLYRAEDLLPVPSICGIRTPSPELTLTDHLQHSQRVKRNVLQELRHLELVLVADTGMYLYLDRNKEAVVRRMINVAGTVDMYYRPFNIRVALIGVEVWTTNQITIDRSASKTLNRFLHWRKKTLLLRLHNDNAHLVILKLPKAFSSCSRADLVRALLQGVGPCLFNLPDPEQLVAGPRCGNLYMDKGEECDCGPPKECTDPCCEPSTCKLKPRAQCPSTGACCKDCQFLPGGTMCRAPMGECDLPEFCTGNFSNCPENVYLQDGHTCSNGTLYCSNGICQSADEQCQEIWGPGARSAEDICYSFTNKAGSPFGNCGKNENNDYIKCQNKDVKCGKIQCKGGNSSPVRGGNVHYSTTEFVINGVQMKCRGTFSNLPDSISPDLIRQGTKCGDKKVCFDRSCQDVNLFNIQNCEETCNYRGVCNSKGNCHCDMGWAPPFCNVRGSGGSIDSGPMKYTTPAPSPETKGTETSITLLLNTTQTSDTLSAFQWIVPVVALFLFLLPLTGFLVRFLMNKGWMCTRARKTTSTTEALSALRSDIDVSTRLQDPLPNTAV
ncbi:disintegrin and metalloproteinase domain-containing protein 12-like isoform X3 [Stegostoma tigrinum]|uniref:disintegrin and metalloproteinase domain-containing protein 12-like isoform X3 n=1 Tax=Stegostoma tigrinum TaxID=3053191 RepID=UPI0028709161|nr:disintegrin and metalloproteinase domain-containing protein 12-like isoform X3 [Stegostoma tigrinum]